MDGNKDEALKCLKIGKDALESGDRPRALKFITKARRLDPNLPVDDLLSALEGDRSSRPSASDSSSTTKNDAQDGDGGSPSLNKPSGIPSLRHRGGPSSGSSSSSASQSHAFTEEQISIVRQIKRQKDYYEILGLEKSCSVEDVRKAYRKFSLKVHPDKNKAPGAEEAFKAVSKAFKCLSDEESRKRYDVSGSDEVVYERAAARRRGAQGFNGFYDADIDAEEIFRSFFFGGAPRATTQFGGFTFGTGMGPSVHTGGDNGSGNFNVRALVQLLPILLIILLNFLPSSQPIYALSKSYPYEYHVVTPRGVNYYVRTAKFEQEYPPSSLERVKLEERVESDYRSIITQNCRVELQRRQWGLTRETPHCDLLRQFEAAA